MSTPLPSNEEARVELDRHIRKTVAVRTLHKIGDMVSDLEKQDRRGNRVMVIACVVLFLVAICAGVAVYFASERYKARTPVTDAAPAATIAYASHSPMP